MAKKKATRRRAPSFEESLAELEDIVAKLEGGELPLADSLGQYEKGVQHLKRCFELLDEAEQRIELVAGLDEDGRPITTQLNDQADGGEKPKRRRKARPAGESDGSGLFS